MSKLPPRGFDQAREEIKFGEDKPSLEDLCKQYPHLVHVFKACTTWGWRSAISRLRELPEETQDFILRKES